MRTVFPQLLAIALFAVPALAQDAATSGGFRDANMKSVMTRIEAHADSFEDKFEAALDKSTLNGSNVEDRLNRWADLLEDEVDNMAENFNEKDQAKFIEHLENSLIIATGVNRAMLRHDLSGAAQEQWSTIRTDLNSVAKAFHRPVLPNVTVVTLVPATGEMLKKSEVKHVMERLEGGTDRFKDKFEKAMHARVVTQTDRADLFRGWADQLEDVSDDMLEEYKENDSREFSQELENTLILAAATNRMMLRSDMPADVRTEWESIRKDLNTVAGVFGYAALPDMIVHVSRRSQ
jgi:hypothetical protein